MAKCKALMGSAVKRVNSRKIIHNNAIIRQILAIGFVVLNNQ